ncbi:hypothetical protein F66182_8373 [Fusarium sp. NRRL 66182]|nr:hypothetical protein F66182_8373 [Fusarium sp. NRRL 66182]
MTKTKTKTAMPPAPPWHFVLHGGCAETCPDPQRQREISEQLHRVAGLVAKALTEGAQARDAVTLAVSALEDSPIFNAGHGAALNRNGIHQLEAAIVDGASGRYAAVGGVQATKNPIAAANALLERGSHTMLVGSGADEAAREFGLETVPNSYFTTPFRRAYWHQVVEQGLPQLGSEMGTVGAIVLDSQGRLAAGGSTGGPTGKLDGRIGDTAILGAGLYADANLAVLCSGAGDQILENLIASSVAKYHAAGATLSDAARKALRAMTAPGASCSLVALDAHGKLVVESTARLFSVASASSSEAPTAQLHPTTFPVLASHEFYSDHQLSIGLSRYPVTRGHALVTIKSGKALFSLEASEFTNAMTQVSTAVSLLTDHYQVERCALASNGADRLSLLPLHGLTKDWQAITSDIKEFHDNFPGYVSSKDGPMMEASRLDDICSRIRRISGLSSSPDYTFQGAQDDKNLFACIVRGELQQWRIWEDANHVAFLTPFANTPGFTVLVPRKHLSSDIFSIQEPSFSDLMLAAHRVAGYLKATFGAERCGMIFEGFEIDYAHVKLIPIHPVDAEFQVSETEDLVVTVAPIQDTYQGYVSSLDGPLCRDQESLKQATVDIKKKHNSLRERSIVRPPRSWASPPHHLSSVLHDPWYKKLFLAQDVLFHVSSNYFQKGLGYRYCLVPATTDAVSSPMGLGSDSEPVPVRFLDQETHLADSMQFSLEYFLRIHDGLPGVYYVNTSFRGEDPDAMHLNQFYHIECELLGPFSDGIKVAEGYVMRLVSALLEEHADAVESVAGTCDHLTSILELYRSHGGRFPSVSVDDALNLPGMNQDCWKYVIPSDASKGRALTRAGELKLIEHFGGAVWLQEMDHLSVPFYQAFLDNSGTKARCADLLIGNGEVLGLGERHVQAEEVLSALKMHDVPAEGYAWYTEMREHKPILTTGWGMGIERFLAWVFQHNDIRDMTIVPRMKGYSFAP